MIYLIGVQEQTSEKGSKVIIDYKQDNSESKSKFSEHIIPKRFFEFIKAINYEFIKLCNIADNDNTSARITGFKIRDVNEGSRQEIQFTVDQRVGGIYYKNAKTDWRELREIPTEVFKTWTIEKQYAEAINGILAVFNELQIYINDELPVWLEMDDNYGPGTLWERKTQMDGEGESSDQILEKNLAAIRKDFQSKMQAMSDKDGLSVTISSEGKDLATFKPKKNEEMAEMP
jgi:hypothetical protein